MTKLSYTWYPKDWSNSEAVFELNLMQKGLYRELIDLAMLNDNKTKIKIAIWSRKWDISKEEIEEILSVLLELELVEIDDKNLFIPSCERRLKLVRGGSKGGSKSKISHDYHNINEKQNKKGFLYICYDDDENNEILKFGVSVNPEKRIYQIRRDSKRPNINLVYTWEVINMIGAEKILYDHFDSIREGEWIKRKMNLSEVINDINKAISEFLIKPLIKQIETKREIETKKKKNIDARKSKFSSSLSPFLETYGKELLNDFYSYWTEPNKSNTKFRQELERTWDLERRLGTWAKNDRNFNKNKASPETIERNQKVQHKLAKHG